ncbi:phage tail protein [Aetokthonos hydrillicola Thurmond2011]|jgi:phage-related protein|uniref:Phage tail protein n=1 Tax=Aetokthonos hydrillicola Thurmond2011 TaxID=2712845 RepID=A0AAP5MDK4_9CYAN|nr:phage tail protein [Aetokthonos hydrillicola]MBO3459946.1 phage tail protein [Aetokthonos hydrillicola CCALA 1050]MBW4584065.1 phage tail protein [Aetokthonos hydrillicola CCALA 1050]MDR9900707.1 phage tail protein [Aetokthonos hydrillicola Thurmond2011]
MYPILPLIPTWGNTENEASWVAKTKYGEAGAEQRDFVGINPLTTSWDINVNIYNFQEVDDFLKTRCGQPFRVSLDGGVTDDGKLYICTEWQIQQLGIGAGNFSARITQVRRFTIFFRIACNAKVLEFLPITFNNSYKFFVNYGVGYTGQGIIQVHKWPGFNNYLNFGSFDERVWIKNINVGGFFEYTPTSVGRYLSFSQRRSDWDTPSFNLSSNIITLTGF